MRKFVTHSYFLVDWLQIFPTSGVNWTTWKPAQARSWPPISGGPGRASIQAKSTFQPCPLAYTWKTQDLRIWIIYGQYGMLMNVVDVLVVVNHGQEWEKHDGSTSSQGLTTGTAMQRKFAACFWQGGTPSWQQTKLEITSWSVYETPGPQWKLSTDFCLKALAVWVCKRWM